MDELECGPPIEHVARSVDEIGIDFREVGNRDVPWGLEQGLHPSGLQLPQDKLGLRNGGVVRKNEDSHENPSRQRTAQLPLKRFQPPEED